MGGDDAVPFPAGDFGREHLATVFREILLAGDQQLGVGIKLHEFPGELLQQVIGHHIHRLVNQPRLLHLHAGGGHRERLAE